MSEYDPNEAAWAASLEEDPLGTVTQIAHAVAAQYQQPQIDPDQVAAQAAVTALEITAAQTANFKSDEEAKMIDRSLAHKWGEDWAELAPRVGALVSQRAQEYEQARAVRGAQGAADFLDELASEVKANHTPEAQEWATIRNARSGGYADNAEQWLAASGVRPGGMGRQG